MTWNAPVEDKCPKCGSTLFKKGGNPESFYVKSLTAVTKGIFDDS